jgi:uncharacterized protein YfkK (UPF0435 family)
MNLTEISMANENLTTLLNSIQEKQNQIDDYLVRCEELRNHKYGDLYNHIPEIVAEIEKEKTRISFDKRQIVENIKYLYSKVEVTNE